ncbi:MAG: hypothetical protein J6J23_07755, partial [Clostridia bacterium]|nr:hypothetical protein [Clostridia bacterium]
MLGQYISKSKSFLNLINDCNKDKMPHALMLVSSDKLYAEKYAENLAKLMLCENKIEGKFCGECNVCQNISKGVHPDVIRFGKEETISSEDAGKITDSFCNFLRKAHTTQRNMPQKEISEIIRQMLFHGFCGSHT